MVLTCRRLLLPRQICKTLTPLFLSVRLNPSPATSTKTGDGLYSHAHDKLSQDVPSSHGYIGKSGHEPGPPPGSSQVLFVKFQVQANSCSHSSSSGLQLRPKRCMVGPGPRSGSQVFILIAMAALVT